MRPDAAALLTHVEQDPASFIFDLSHGGGKLLATVAAQRAEGIAGETFGVYAAEHVLSVADLALDEGDVMLAVELVDEAVSAEIAVFGRQAHRGDLLDQLFVAFAVALQILDGDEFYVVFFRQLKKLRRAHHGAVLAHDLAAQAALLETGQAAEIHRRFGVAVALQDAVFSGQQREHVPRTAKILRP